MDSIQVRASNMPQTSGHTIVNFGDLISGGSLIASKTYDIVVPRGTIVDKANVLLKTPFSSGMTSCQLTIGDVNTANAIHAVVDLKGSAAAHESAIANRFHTVTPSTDGDTNEQVYVVRYTIASGGSTVPTAGQVIIWFDYRFAPNSAYISKSYGETSVSESAGSGY